MWVMYCSATATYTVGPISNAFGCECAKPFGGFCSHIEVPALFIVVIVPIRVNNYSPFIFRSQLLQYLGHYAGMNAIKPDKSKAGQVFNLLNDILNGSIKKFTV